jgi:signal transduction histidine kinase
MNKDIHFLIQAESRALLSRNLIKDTLRDGKAEGEFIFRKKDRGTFPGYLSSSLIQERGRNPDVVVVIADLTRLHEVERRLKYSEKMASLGKVVEGVAHEVRNCLTSLGGFALRLKKTVNDNPTGNEYVEIILKDVKRLEKMVKDIEEYVRFSKFHQFRMSSVDLVEIAQKARNRALQKLSSEMNRVVFVLNEESNLPKISADPEALEEVFYNIILNSYEAMPKGGRLKVDMKRIGSSIGILFSDTGIGIENEDLTEIFNPFVTSKTSGAGMGLSKALLLVEEHGGTLKVSSQPHKGAVFQLTLPIERSANGFS